MNVPIPDLAPPSPSPLRRWIDAVCDPALTAEEREAANQRYIREQDQCLADQAVASRRAREIADKRNARIDDLEALIDARVNARLRELGLLDLNEGSTDVG